MPLSDILIHIQTHTHTHTHESARVNEMKITSVSTGLKMTHIYNYTNDKDSFRNRFCLICTRVHIKIFENVYQTNGTLSSVLKFM